MARYLVIDATPTLDTSAYASGDRLGSLITLTGAGPGGFHGAVLESVAVLDKDKQGAALKVLFFDRQPTISSADNAPLDISSAQSAGFLAHVSVAAADYVSTASSKLGYTQSLRGVALVPSSAGVQETLYAQLVSAGTPTYTASGLTVRFTFRWDI